MGLSVPYGNVVPIRRRPMRIGPDSAILEFSHEHPHGHVRLMDKCEGLIHVFSEVPGRCQCGSEVWTTEA